MTFTVFSEDMPGQGGIGDLNNDGFLDVFSSNIYYNNGNSNNWIKIQTNGDSSNEGGIGARVEIVSPGIGKQIRDVRSGEGFRYMSSLTTHFGLGTDTSVSSITIYWPSGAVDVINNPSLNQNITIEEGAPLGLESTIAEDLILHPNPTKKFLNINTKYNLENLIYSIFDLSGKRHNEQ